MLTSEFVFSGVEVVFLVPGDRLEVSQNPDELTEIHLVRFPPAILSLEIESSKFHTGKQQKFHKTTYIFYHFVPVSNEFSFKVKQ